MKYMKMSQRKSEAKEPCVESFRVVFLKLFLFSTSKTDVKKHLVQCLALSTEARNVMRAEEAMALKVQNEETRNEGAKRRKRRGFCGRNVKRRVNTK